MLKKFMLIMTLMVVLVSSTAFAGGLMQLVPQGSAFILHVNVEKITSMPEVKEAIAQGMAKSSKQKEAFDKFVTNTGMDPMTDIKELVLFSAAKVEAGEKSPLGAVLLRGNYNKAKLLEMIKKDPKAAKDVKIGKIGKYDAALPINGKEGYGVFIDDNTVAFGAEPGVKKVIAVKDGKAKALGGNTGLAAILKKVDMAATLSGAGVIPADLKAKLKNTPQAASLAALDYFFFSFNHGKMITFNFNGEVDKKENVETVMTSLNGFLAMLKMFAGQAPEAGEILNMVKLGANAKTIQISLSVSKAKLEEIKKKIEARVGQMKQKKGK